MTYFKIDSFRSSGGVNDTSYIKLALAVGTAATVLAGASFVAYRYSRKGTFLSLEILSCNKIVWDVLKILLKIYVVPRCEYG